MVDLGCDRADASVRVFVDNSIKNVIMITNQRIKVFK